MISYSKGKGVSLKLKFRRQLAKGIWMGGARGEKKRIKKKGKGEERQRGQALAWQELWHGEE